MLADLKAIRISGGRDIVLRKGPLPIFNSVGLHITSAEYTENDSSGRPIRIGKGAVAQVLGGTLTWADYDAIAGVMLDEQIVGPDVAEAAASYQRLARNGEPTAHSKPWMSLLRLSAFHPMQEIMFLALRANAVVNRSGPPPQPFETP